MRDETMTKTYSCPYPGCGRVSQLEWRVREHVRIAHRDKTLRRIARLKRALERRQAPGR